MQRRRFLQAGAATALATAVPAQVLASPPGAPAPAAGSGALVPVDPRTDAADAARFRAVQRVVPTRFGRIAVADTGGRGEAALFLHGFPLSGYQWRGALARLSPHRRCIAPDFLGMGQTAVADGQAMAPEDQADMLVALMDAMAVERADLVANDSGGAVAQLLMLRQPERVRSVLLTNCDTEVDCPPEALQPVFEKAREGRFALDWLAPWLEDRALAREPTGLGGLAYTYPDALGDEAIATYLVPLVADPARTDAFARALDRNVLAGTSAALRASRIPTRVVWGMADDVFGPRGVDHLEDTLGALQGMRRVEGARLFFPEEFPDLLAAEALALWNT